jgi:2-keto-3-deoxy-galactonokinase
VLVGDLAAEQVSPYLSGLLIGSEIQSAMAMFDAGSAAPLIIAEPALAATYEGAFRQLGHAALGAPADAAVRGLFAVARSATLV